MSTEFLGVPLIGKTLPDIQLEVFHENQFKKISLSSFKGKWLILFFYPADFTFVCPTELVDVAKQYDTFKSLNTEILGVSTDTVFVHKAWFDHSQAIHQVTFPLAADPTSTLCRMLGTYIPEEGLSYRATFIIDPDQKIKCVEMHDNSIGRNAQELIRKLQAAQYVREHNGEVCPANWKPGDTTLKPGIELVGKI